MIKDKNLIKKYSKKLKDVKNSNAFLYDRVTTTAKVYKNYWKCETLNEARIEALIIMGA